MCARTVLHPEGAAGIIPKSTPLVCLAYLAGSNCSFPGKQGFGSLVHPFLTPRPCDPCEQIARREGGDYCSAGAGRQDAEQV